MSRFASVLLALSLVFVSSASWALGLGSLVSGSVLNQPFKGEIQLYDAKADELDNIEARLASPDEYEKASVPRPFFLTQLKFEPGLNDAGDPVIQVSSRNPIREPFMDFLVEVVWPEGRIVKEFTILLDPPRAGVESPEVVVKGQLISSETFEPKLETEVVATETPEASSPEASPSETPAEPKTPNLAETSKTKEPPAAKPKAATGGGEFPIHYGPVKAGVGLWRAASTIAPKGATVQQVAMALYRSNPKAFGGGSVNNLLTGSKLVIPSAAELYALAPAEAGQQYSAALAGQPVTREPLAPLSDRAAEQVASAPSEDSTGADPLKKKSEAPSLADNTGPEGDDARSAGAEGTSAEAESTVAETVTETGPEALAGGEETDSGTADEPVVAEGSAAAQAQTDTKTVETAASESPEDARQSTQIAAADEAATDDAQTAQAESIAAADSAPETSGSAENTEEATGEASAQTEPAAQIAIDEDSTAAEKSGDTIALADAEIEASGASPSGDAEASGAEAPPDATATNDETDSQAADAQPAPKSDQTDTTTAETAANRDAEVATQTPPEPASEQTPKIQSESQPAPTATGELTAAAEAETSSPEAASEAATAESAAPEETAMQRRIQELEAQLSTLRDNKAAPPPLAEPSFLGLNPVLLWSLAGAGGVLLLALLGFVGFKFVSGRGKSKAEAEAETETETETGSESELPPEIAGQELEEFAFELSGIDQPPPEADASLAEPVEDQPAQTSDAPEPEAPKAEAPKPQQPPAPETPSEAPKPMAAEPPVAAPEPPPVAAESPVAAPEPPPPAAPEPPPVVAEPPAAEPEPPPPEQVESQPAAPVAPQQPVVLPADFDKAAALEIKSLTKADSYMSYGRHRDAQAALMTALAKIPDSSALQLKLAEAYVAGGDTDDFAKLQQRMVARGIPGRHPEVWNRILAMVGAAGVASAAATSTPAPPQSEPTPEPEPALTPELAPERPQADADADDSGHDSLRLDFNDLDEADMQLAFPEAAGGRKNPVTQERMARLDMIEIAPGDPDLDVSLPLQDLDQQLGGGELGESAFADLDAFEQDDDSEPSDHGSSDEPVVAEDDDRMSLDLPEFDENPDEPPTEVLSPLERATEAARNSRGVDPFEELVAAELGTEDFDQPQVPSPTLTQAPSLDPSQAPAVEMPELELPDLDVSTFDQVPEEQGPDAGSELQMLDPPDETPAPTDDPASDLAADIEKFLAGGDGGGEEPEAPAVELSTGLENLDLDMSSEAGFHTQVLPSSAPPGQSPSSSIPELDMDLEDFDSIYNQKESDAPSAAQAPAAEPKPEPTGRREEPGEAMETVSRPASFSEQKSDAMGFRDSSAEETPMFGDESLMQPDSGASDVLSSQWRMDSALWDEVATKMDLAFAYIEMEDTEAARAILEEVIREGNDDQRTEAEGLLKKIDG